MEIQPLLFADLDAVAELKPADWPDIITPIKFYTTAAFCFPLKAIIDGRIAGTGTAIIHNNIAWLAHIIVHPGYRNKGIGKQITKSLIDIAYQKHCDPIYLIATELGELVYKKLGFETETEYLFFKDIKTNNNQLTPKNIFPYTTDVRTQIESLDKLVSGEERMHHLELYLSNGYVYKQNDTVGGFYLPDFGEGLIIAETSAAGLALMQYRFGKKENISFPKDNTAAVAWMHSNGYTAFKTAKRMHLGKKRNWQPENIYGRIGGNLG